jgi:hypothetical protein
MPASGDESSIDEPLARSLLRQFKRNARDMAKRIESNPWTHECRRVRADVERTGNESLWVDFQRRFLQAQVLLYARVRERGGAPN